MPYHQRPYYKKPDELFALATHKPAKEPVHKQKKCFSWGTVILVVLVFVLLALGALYGGFDPLSFPGDFGY